MEKLRENREKREKAEKLRKSGGGGALSFPFSPAHARSHSEHLGPSENQANVTVALGLWIENGI